MSSIFYDKPYLAIHSSLLSEEELQDQNLANKFVRYVSSNQKILNYCEESSHRWEISLSKTNTSNNPDIKSTRANLIALKQRSKLNNKKINDSEYRDEIQKCLQISPNLDPSLIEDKLFKDSETDELSEDLLKILRTKGDVPKEYWRKLWEDIEEPQEMLDELEKLNEFDKDKIIKNYIDILQYLPIIADNEDRIERVFRSANFAAIKAVLEYCCDRKSENHLIIFSEEEFTKIQMRLPKSKVKAILQESLSSKPTLQKIPMVKKWFNSSHNKQDEFKGFYSSDDRRIKAPARLNKKQVKEILKKDKDLRTKIIKSFPDLFCDLLVLLKEYGVKLKFSEEIEMYSDAVNRHQPNIKLVPENISKDYGFRRLTGSRR